MLIGQLSGLPLSQHHKQVLSLLKLTKTIDIKWIQGSRDTLLTNEPKFLDFMHIFDRFDKI